MIVAPCSIKTLAALASCHADTLIARAGDVTLKEGRPLLALVRETPLHVGHLRQMLAFAEMGGIVFPPGAGVLPAAEDGRRHRRAHRGRVLERMGLAHEAVAEWTAGGRRPSEG
jgi:4-hydroxy-3-polyprenylbenzoate decarboxylase